ncbi:hypothetical protein JVT61DRAFT_4712 [Boletus reticuloceps]|uniref:VWFA domain-containing protein n=1 Tax=Boletus reticuloceps TaxID=495285 RepID=A0A8I3A723_9AGAM|nr:hypothetical protein JVT61DRAFT_4712 [Boletus reticuloceps]
MSFSRKSAHQKHASHGSPFNKGSPMSASAEFSTRTVITERSRLSEHAGSRPITPVVVETRSSLQKEEWLVAARRSTEHFKKHGSPVPLVWVLTEGNQIPDNAVPFGADRNGCTMYIARALLEGGLHIGKASPQFSGAVIGYAGKEHIIANYEVLVCASQLRWGFAPPAESEGALVQGTVVLAQQRAQRSLLRTKLHHTEVDVFNTTLVESDIPRFIPECVDVDREAGLRDWLRSRLSSSLTDSMSMQEGNLWEQAREALAGIVDIANQYGSKGADIHFMHWDDYAPNMQVIVFPLQTLQKDTDRNHCEDTPTGAKLGQIINHYVPLIEPERTTHEPITVVVITDGLPTDQEDLERVIVDAAHRLDRHHVKQDMFGIQFVQIGTDPAASELLHVLDNHLETRYKIRDLVDSTPYDPAHGAFDTEYMLKILLGGLHKDLDRAGPNSGQSALLSPLNPTPRHFDRSPRGLTARLGADSPRLGTLSVRPGGY